MENIKASFMMMIFAIIAIVSINLFTGDEKSIIAKDRTHAFEDIIDKEELSKYPTINKVGKLIQSRDSFYDNLYEVSIRIVDKFIVFAGILIPIFMLIWLIPIVLVSFIFSNEQSTLKDKLLNILTLIFILCTVIFLIYVIGFYLTTLVYSLPTLFMEILYIIFMIFIAVISIPIVFIILAFTLTGIENTFIFFEEGTMKNIIIELTNYHLSSLGITIQIDATLLFLTLKTIILLIVIKNINMIGNILFFNFNNFITTIAKVVLIVGFVASIYLFNIELYQKLYLLFTQIVNIVI